MIGQIHLLNNVSYISAHANATFILFFQVELERTDNQVSRFANLHVGKRGGHFDHASNVNADAWIRTGL